VSEVVHGPRLSLELAARHVREIEVVYLVRGDVRVGQALLARLHEEFAEPLVALPELRHRRTDYSDVHMRTLSRRGCGRCGSDNEIG